MFIINCKNYREVSSAGMGRLINTAAAASRRFGVRIAVAPPQHLAATAASLATGAAGSGRIDILAQHVDDAAAGSTTGFVVPDLLRDAGVSGSLVNHSEHRIEPAKIDLLVARLRRLEMTSVLCVRDAAEASKYAALAPDYIAVEPPELIGSGRAVSKERPELITEAAAAIKGAGGRTRLLCGAGIASGDDVSRAIELGSAGILVASGIIKSTDWDRAISEFAGSMRDVDG